MLKVPKVDIDKLMDDVVSINNQLNGLKLLLDNKKALLAKYFESTGEKQLSNEECTVYVREKANITYDIDKVQNKVGDKAKMFIDKEYTVPDWDGFVKLCKLHNISPAQLRPYISVKKSVDEKKLAKLYERGIVAISDLEGCYDATITKSVALRMKNVEREFPLKESK